MSNLEEALRDKISVLEAEKLGLQEELEEAFQRIDSQIEVCESLLNGDVDGLLEVKSEPKKRGRPKGSTAKAKTPAKKRARARKKNPEDAKNKQLYDEAVNSLPDGSTGTTAEQHERALRRFNPTPRGDIGQPGVNVGSTKGKPPSPDEKPDPAGHKTISMEDDLPEEE